MIKLTTDKLITRETAELERTTPIAVRLHPKYQELWLKGKRESFSISYGELLDYLRKRAAFKGRK